VLEHDGADVGASPVQQLGSQPLTAVGPFQGHLVGIQGRFGPLLLGPQMSLA
jgi:hypothetical protein